MTINSPNVKIIKGRDRIFRIGRIKVLITPKKVPAKKRFKREISKLNPAMKEAAK
jgi:hypothetical protein